MEAPNSAVQVGLFVLFVLPGITFASVRTVLVGNRATDSSVAARILEALFVSAIFDFIYVLIFGGSVADLIRKNGAPLLVDPRGYAFLGFALLVFIPAAAAAGSFLDLRMVRGTEASGEPAARRHIVIGNNYRSIPQAWDFKALKGDTPRWVRVRLENGCYYGGRFGHKSYVSTYPAPRDIFIEEQWKMSENGDFCGEVESASGIWLPITDKCVVEWLS